MNLRIIIVSNILANILIAQHWIGVIPDTQHYTTDPINRMPHFSSITYHLSIWNPDVITHVGDVTQNASQIEFERAISALSTIRDNNIPLLICPGNHDYDNGQKPNLTRFNQFIGPSFSWYRTNELLLINLGWLPDDIEVDSARRLLEQDPPITTIITTHEWLLNDNTISNYGSNLDNTGNNSASQLWHKLIEPYPQIKLVICGHSHGEATRTDNTILGSSVHQLLFNPQDDPLGGQGFFRAIAFWQGRIDVYSLSMSWIGLFPNRTSFFSLQNNSSIPNTIHIRNGIDTTVIPVWPTSTRGSHDQVIAANTGAREIGLLRFNIPSINNIQTAILTLSFEGYSANGDGFRLHKMLRSWNESDSWSSLNGISNNDLAPATIPDISPVRKGSITIDVTQDVRSWLTNTNNGWAVIGLGESIAFRSFNWISDAEKPMLTISYN